MSYMRVCTSLIRRYIHAVMHVLKGTVKPREDIYEQFNCLRQDFITHATTLHFERREDDPAPLLNRTLLDVGCGTSTVGSFLVLSGAEITAVDPDEDALEQARIYAETHGTSMRFIHGKAEDLVARGEKFDVILCLDVMEAVEDPDKFIWSLARLLNPGGVMIFSVIARRWKAWFLHIFMSQILLKRITSTRHFHQFYTPQQLTEYLKKYQLSVQNIQWMTFDPDAQTWELSHSPDTRYMAVAIHK